MNVLQSMDSSTSESGHAAFVNFPQPVVSDNYDEDCHMPGSTPGIHNDNIF